MQLYAVKITVMSRFELARFLPFRLNRLAAEVSERLAELYERHFGIDIPQWRVLATLSSGEHTAQAIVASTRTHKSTRESSTRSRAGRSSGSDMVSWLSRRPEPASALPSEGGSRILIGAILTRRPPRARPAPRHPG